MWLEKCQVVLEVIDGRKEDQMTVLRTIDPLNREVVRLDKAA